MKKSYSILVVFLFIHFKSQSQPGTLDPTYGSAGKVLTDFNGADDLGNSMAVQSDGKLVFAGYSHNGSDYDVALVRYNDDGTLDESFGNTGKVTTPVMNGNDFGLSCVIQSDGKIVVGGYSFNGVNNDFAVIRYNDNGTLDNTFDADGIATTAVGDFGEVAYSMVIQSDGKIILAGYSDDATTNFFALVRYNSDGSLDNTFGTGGKVTTHIGTTDDQCYSVTLQSDGKIVAGGYTFNGVNWDFAIVRYNSDGTPDNTFGGDGIVITPIGTSDEECYGVAVQPDGKIIGAGYTVDNFTLFAVVRYNADGSLDNSFDADGIVTTNIGGNDNDANEVRIQSDGKIVVAGNSLNGTNWDFGLIRYNADGSPDSTFGTNGKVLTDFSGGNDFCLSLLIQNDDKIVGGGFGDGIGRDFVSARYDAGAVGIPGVPRGNSLVAFPNPFTSQLTVSGTSAKGELILYDLSGKELLRQHASAGTTAINTGKILPGMYLLGDETGKHLRVVKR